MISSQASKVRPPSERTFCDVLQNHMASQQHGCLGKFTVNHNPASVLKELSEQNYNKDCLMLTDFALEKVFGRKQFVFNYHSY